MGRKLFWGFALCVGLTLLVVVAAQAATPVDLPTTGNWLDAAVISDGFTQLRLVVSGAPQLVTLEMRADKDNFKLLAAELWDEPDEDMADSIWGLPSMKKSGSKGAFKQTFCLNPGAYYVVVSRYLFADYGPFSIPFQVRATTKALSGHALDPEPNNSPLEAMPVAPGQAQAGLIAIGDEDHYKLVLDQDVKLRLTLKQYRAQMALEMVRLKDGMTDADIRQYLNLEGGYADDPSLTPLDDLARLKGSKNAKAPSAKSLNISLSKGTYYLRVSVSYGKTINDGYSFYDLTLQAAGEPVINLIMPKSYKLPLGMSTTIKAGIKPTYFDVVPVAYASSVPEVAGVDSVTGMVTPVKAGKTTITATTLDGKKRASTTLSVLGADANRFGRAKPLSGKSRGVWTSTKALYYEGETLIADVFVYNRAGRNINLNYLYGVEGALVELVDMDADNDNARDPVDASEYAVLKTQPLPSGIPSQLVKPGKYAVIKAQIAGVPGLVLVNGRYNVVVSDDAYEKVNGFLRFGKGSRGALHVGGALPTMKNVQTDPAAQPEYGVRP